MTRNEIIRRYPNASRAFLKANLDPELPDPKPERDQAPALGTAVPRETKGLPRTRVRFVGYRCRPLDPDNFAGGTKDLLDGLKHAGLIEGDEPWKIILETEQIKVSKRSEQKTVVIIEEL